MVAPRLNVKTIARQIQKGYHSQLLKEDMILMNLRSVSISCYLYFIVKSFGTLVPSIEYMCLKIHLSSPIKTTTSYLSLSIS